MKPLSDKDPCPTGAHEGTPMGQVPAKYLDWVIGQRWITKTRNTDWIRIRDYIEANLPAIQADIEDDD